MRVNNDTYIVLLSRLNEIIHGKASNKYCRPDVRQALF